MIAVGVSSIYLGIKIILDKKTRAWWAKWWWGFLNNQKRAEKQVVFFDAPIVIGAGMMILWTVLSIVLAQFNIFIF